MRDSSARLALDKGGIYGIPRREDMAGSAKTSVYVAWNVLDSPTLLRRLRRVFTDKACSAGRKRRNPTGSV